MSDRRPAIARVPGGRLDGRRRQRPRGPDRAHRRARADAGDAQLVPRLRDERDRRPRAARRARRPEAGPPPRPLRDARPGPAAEPRLPEVRVRGRRGDGEVPPTQRCFDLRHARSPRAGLRASLPARGRPGQLRLDRRRPGGGDAVHGGPPRPPRDGDAPRHRCGYRRLRAELRRDQQGADRPAVAVPEPAGQRRHRHRRRHGDQHPAAQSDRDRRGDPRLHREPGHRPRRPDGAREGPRLPRRRADERAGNPRRVRVGARERQGPGPRPRRAHPRRQGRDRHLRASLHGQKGRRGRPDHEDRRPRPREEDHRDLRPARRVRPLRHADRDRAEARRRSRGRGPQSALQAHAAAELVRDQHGRARRRRAADARAEGADRPLRRPPARGRHPAHPVRAAPGRGPGARPRGHPDRARQPRRGHRADPRLRRSRDGPRRVDGEVQPLGDPGAGDPGHAPPAPDRARVRQGARGAQGAAGQDRRAARDPRRPRPDRRCDRRRARAR